MIMIIFYAQVVLIMIQIKKMVNIIKMGETNEKDIENINELLKDGKLAQSIANEIRERVKEELEVEYIIDSYKTKDDLIDKFLEHIQIYYDKAQTFWRWNNGLKFYEKIDEVEILNLIKGSSGANTIKSNERTEILNAIKQSARLKKPLDVPDSYIQFKDEVVDLDTGHRFAADKKYFYTNPIPWKIGKYPDTPNMDRIFSEWSGSENLQVLYEIIAYCLYRGYPIQRIFVFLGAGSNGKSCYLNLIRKFLGIKNTTTTELDTLLNSRFEITKLHKKLVCFMGETNFKELENTSILKRLTGNDLIGFEEKNKTPFDDINYAKIVISTNNLPVTNDKSIGFYRRWFIIDFPNQFTEHKDILKEIPDQEFENLALKAIGMLIELLDKRSFTNEGSIEDRMKRYDDKSNPFDKFIKEYCDLEDPDGYIFRFDFAEKFNSFCKEHRFRQFSDISISKMMKNHGIITFSKQTDWLKDGKLKLYRAWGGIKWKN